MQPLAVSMYLCSIKTLKKYFQWHEAREMKKLTCLGTTNYMENRHGVKHFEKNIILGLKEKKKKKSLICNAGLISVFFFSAWFLKYLNTNNNKSTRI